MYLQLLARKKAFFQGMAWERAVTRAIVLLFAYSFVVAYAGKDAMPPLLQLANNGKQFNGMLFKTTEGYNFYDFTPMNFNAQTTDVNADGAKTEMRSFDFVPIANEELVDPETNKLPDEHFSFDILSAGTLLANDGAFGRIYDTDDRRNYDLIREKTKMDAVTFTSRKDILYTAKDENGSLVIRYFFANCREPQSYSLEENDRPAGRVLRTLDLPVQNKILLSPSQVYAAIIDQTNVSKLRVMNLISGQVTVLNVPSLSDAQIHFLPTFIGDDQIAFSTYDNGNTSTQLYSIKSGTFNMLSADFSDAIYLSRTGEIVLLQTFNSLAGNVPFGSHAILTKKAAVFRSAIVNAVGSEDTSWSDVFVDPTAPLLTFKPNAKELFAGIRDPETRRIVQEFWSSLYDPNLPKDMEMKIIRWQNGQGTADESMLYTVDATHPRVDWSFNVSPLLRILGLPDEVITEYNDQRVRALNRNEGTYELINIQ